MTTILNIFILLNMLDLYKKISDDSFTGILRSLEMRLEDPDFSLDYVKGELESLYKYEGLDYDGRGEVLQAQLEGQILAFEVFISRFDKEVDAS